MSRTWYRARSLSRCILGLLVVAALFPALAVGQPSSGIGISDGQARSAGPGHPWQGGPGGVNLYSLAKQTTIPLISWRTVGGMPMAFTLFNNSQSVHSNKALGVKWQHSYASQLLKWTDRGVDKIAVLFSDHHVRMFRKVGTSWVPQDGYRDTLMEVGLNFELTLSMQAKMVFKPNIGLSTVRRYRLDSMTTHGVTATMTYDANFRLARVDEPSGRSLRLTYAGQSLASVAFWVGNTPQRTWNFSYDGQGRLVQIQLPPVTTDLGIQNYAFSFTYDGSSNLASISSPEGLTSQYGYSGNEIAFEQWPGNSSSQRVVYTKNGALRTVADPVGNTAIYEYDSLSRLVRARDGAGIDTLIGFTDPDYAYGPSTVTNGAGDVQGSDYDARGNLIGLIDAAGKRWDYAYDSRNNLVQVLAPLVTDAWGVQQAGRHRTDYAYDSLSRRILKNEYSSPTAFNSTQYDYDAVGNLIRVTDPMTHATTFDYDARGNLVRTTSPMGRMLSFFYDTMTLSAGFTVPNAWSDANGLRTELIRDEWGRLRGTDFVAQPDHQYRYDGMSRLVRMSDGSGVTTYSYDSHGWLASVVRGASFFNCSYYPNGLRGAVLHDTGTGPVSINYVYNSRGLLGSMNDMGAISQYTYDAAGRLVSRQMGNGASSLYSYANGRLAGVLQRDQALMPIVQYAYAYQADGRLAQCTDGGGMTRYGYDFLDRLIREERNAGPAYAYLWDLNNDGLRVQQNRNGVLTSYVNDADHNLIQAIPQGSAPEMYQYDTNGRLVQRVRNNNSEIFRFGYDTRGLLTRMELFNAGTNTFDLHRSYEYDGMGRRIRRDAFAGGAPFSQALYNYGPIEPEIVSMGLQSCELIRVDWVVQGQPKTEVMTWAGGLRRINDLAGQSIWPATDGRGDLRSYTNTLGQYTGHNATQNAFGEVVSSQGTAPMYQWRADYGVRTEGDAGLVFDAVGDGIWAGSGAWPGFYDSTTGRSLPRGAALTDDGLWLFLAGGGAGSTALLPAIQKVREAAAWPTKWEFASDGSVRFLRSPGSALPGVQGGPDQGSLVDITDFTLLMGNKGTVADPILIGLLLPAIQRSGPGGHTGGVNVLMGDGSVRFARGDDGSWYLSDEYFKF